MNSPAPFYIVPMLDALATLPAEAAEERARLRELLAVNVGDPDLLADLLGDSPESFDDFYDERTSDTPETNDTISRFLTAYAGGTRPIPEEVPVVPAIDYAATVLGDAPSTPPAAPPAPPVTTPSTHADQVKILVKNGKYEEALQIIEELNLKNPEKSIYFADQMRFLRKLIYCKTKTNS